VKTLGWPGIAPIGWELPSSPLLKNFAVSAPSLGLSSLELQPLNRWKGAVRFLLSFTLANLSANGEIFYCTANTSKMSDFGGSSLEMYEIKTRRAMSFHNGGLNIVSSFDYAFYPTRKQEGYWLLRPPAWKRNGPVLKEVNKEVSI